MTKRGSVVLSLVLLGLILVAVVIAVSRVKPPAETKTTPSRPPPPSVSKTDDRGPAPRLQPSLPDDDGNYVDRSGAMGKAADHLAPPPPVPGTGRPSRSHRQRRHVIERRVMADIRTRLHGIIDRCVATARPAWSDAGKQSHIVLRIAIEAGELRVREVRASLSTTDDRGAAACIRAAAADLRVSADDHQDVTSHTIRLTLRVRG